MGRGPARMEGATFYRIQNRDVMGYHPHCNAKEFAVTTQEVADSIATQIRIQLAARRMSQGDLAGELGLGQPAISMMLKRGTYTLATLVAVANAFNLDLQIRLVNKL